MPGGLDLAGWSAASDRYFSIHSSLATGAKARSASLFEAVEQAGRWRVRQVLEDPEAWHDMAIIAEVDLASSDALGSPAWLTLGLEQG